MAQLKTITVIGNGEFISYETPNYHSREQVVIDPTTIDLQSGTAMAVLTATGNYVPWNPGASDGSQTFKGFLFAKRVASTATQRAVVLVRDMDFNINKITFVTTPTAAQLTAFLAAAAQLRMIGRG